MLGLIKNNFDKNWFTERVGSAPVRPDNSNQNLFSTARELIPPILVQLIFPYKFTFLHLC